MRHAQHPAHVPKSFTPSSVIVATLNDPNMDAPHSVQTPSSDTVRSPTVGKSSLIVSYPASAFAARNVALVLTAYKLAALVVVGHFLVVSTASAADDLSHQ